MLSACAGAAVRWSMRSPATPPYVLREYHYFVSTGLPESPESCLFLPVPELAYKMCATPGFYAGTGDGIRVEGKH